MSLSAFKSEMQQLAGRPVSDAEANEAARNLEGFLRLVAEVRLERRAKVLRISGVERPAAQG
jgi:hypothetical protein